MINIKLIKLKNQMIFHLLPLPLSPVCLPVFPPSEEKNILACDKNTTFIKKPLCLRNSLPHCNSSLPSEQSFLPSHFMFPGRHDQLPTRQMKAFVSAQVKFLDSQRLPNHSPTHLKAKQGDVIDNVEDKLHEGKPRGFCLPSLHFWFTYRQYGRPC